MASPTTNLYPTMVSRLATELATLTQYTGLVISTQVFRAAALPAFTTYAIIVSPSNHPWDERLISTRSLQYVFRVDLYLLVKNFHVSQSLFNTTAPLGIFQMAEDVKTLLRASTLSGLLDKSYMEAGGDPAHGGAGGLDFEELAAAGFDAGEYIFVHRLRIPYIGRMQPFCFERTP
jgi:hypothetical protein